MLNQSDESCQQTKVRKSLVSLASTSGGTRQQVGLCCWSPLTGIKTWSVIPSPLLGQRNPLAVFQQCAPELLPLIISHSDRRVSVAGGSSQIPSSLQGIHLNALRFPQLTAAVALGQLLPPPATEPTSGTWS